MAGFGVGLVASLLWANVDDLLPLRPRSPFARLSGFCQ